MKSITIGLTSPTWRPAAKARYYAERGDGEEYAFGATPAEALARLEKREAGVTPKVDKTLAEEIAFLALGAENFLKEHSDARLDLYDGYQGFIGEVIRHAPMLSERWRRMETDEFGGAWLYDVTERFGREWAEELFNQTGTSPASQLESIIKDEMDKWQ
ncbi:MAG: hypothetical protein EPN68_02525 [Rhodanobacter sp.]|nr:MAG: hypothetical protein EPN68_02525 [Rhodanobacter sp.]